MKKEYKATEEEKKQIYLLTIGIRDLILSIEPPVNLTIFSLSCILSFYIKEYNLKISDITDQLQDIILLSRENK